MTSKSDLYQSILQRIKALVEGETDEIAVMATIACELNTAMENFHWTGFYRRVEDQLLKVGPYQGGHGCLTIEFSRGVCGKAAREGQTQLVDDVNDLPYHIACSSSTRSEIVVPVVDPNGRVRAVLDIDSNYPSSFDTTDQDYLEEICGLIKSCYSN